MRQRILLGTLSILLLSVALTRLVAYTETQSCTSEDDVYDGRIQQVKGTVTLLNLPTLGKTPANGQYLVFQREDCKKCLVATHADLNGEYKIFVGVGRYKLIVRQNICDYGGAGCDCYDLLAADQPRYLDVARSRPYTEEFNINLVLRKK